MQNKLKEISYKEKTSKKNKTKKARAPKGNMLSDLVCCKNYQSDSVLCLAEEFMSHLMPIIESVRAQQSTPVAYPLKVNSGRSRTCTAQQHHWVKIKFIICLKKYDSINLREKKSLFFIFTKRLISKCTGPRKKHKKRSDGKHERYQIFVFRRKIDARFPQR